MVSTTLALGAVVVTATAVTVSGLWSVRGGVASGTEAWILLGPVEAVVGSAVATD